MTIEGELTKKVSLHDVFESDLPIFFEQQLDSTANHMAAFSSKDPSNRDAFNTHWVKILSDNTIIKKTIVLENLVAGHRKLL